MHLKKPAVISVRVPWGTRVLIEGVALKAGVPYSDFVRMALLIGARQQAELLGVKVEVGFEAVPELVSGKVPTYSERIEAGRSYAWYSSGKISDNWEEEFEKKMTALGIRK